MNHTKFRMSKNKEKGKKTKKINTNRCERNTDIIIQFGHISHTISAANYILQPNQTTRGHMTDTSDSESRW